MNNKTLKYIKYAILILGFASCFLVYFNTYKYYPKFGNYAWRSLIFVMMIRPVIDIFPKVKILNFLFKFRKEFGILVGFFTLAHALGYIKMVNYSNPFLYFTDSHSWSDFMLFGMLAFIVCIPLLLTSNIFSMKKLGKKWKLLQRLSYLMFIFTSLHIYLLYHETYVLIILFTWIILYFIAFFKKKRS